jgi:hypothetical protein
VVKSTAQETKCKRNSSIERDSVLALKICLSRLTPNGLWFWSLGGAKHSYLSPDATSAFGPVSKTFRFDFGPNYATLDKGTDSIAYGER